MEEAKNIKDTLSIAIKKYGKQQKIMNMGEW